MATAHPTAEATAHEAMRRWISGARGGDWSGLVEMLHPEVIFHVPVEGFAGPRHGVAEARRFFDHLAVAVRAQLTVTAVLTDGQRFGFEVAVAGLWLNFVTIFVAIELAALSALGAYFLGGYLRKRPPKATAFLPFGLFLAPAIWIGWLVEAVFG